MPLQDTHPTPAFGGFGVRNIDEVTKEEFDRLVGGRVNHTSTMVEILERYDVEVARQRSPSFRYFWQKHIH